MHKHRLAKIEKKPHNLGLKREIDIFYRWTITERDPYGNVENTVFTGSK